MKYLLHKIRILPCEFHRAFFGYVYTLIIEKAVDIWYYINVNDCEVKL